MIALQLEKLQKIQQNIDLLNESLANIVNSLKDKEINFVNDRSAKYDERGVLIEHIENEE
jgi:hypothetical protein